MEAGKNPIENREKGINYCINQGYDILIFGDSDDYFSRNRVEKSIELLSKYSIVVNDLNLFDKQINETMVHSYSYKTYQV